MPTATRPALVRLLPLLALVLCLSATGFAQSTSLWTDLRSDEAPLVGQRLIAPETARTLHLRTDALTDVLAAAPLESRPGNLDGAVLFPVPLPDGGFADFRVVESPIMAPALQAKYPSIRTYVGRSVEGGMTLRLSVTPQGLHGAVRTPRGHFYLDPYSQFDREHVVAYWRENARRAPGFEFERLHDEVLDDHADHGHAEAGRGDAPSRFEHGTTLRILRAAISATAQYTAFHSVDEPTVEEGLAAIVVSLARVNEVYEQELATRMILVANNDTLIFTDPDDQPFTNNNLGQFINQNQQVVDARIGNANYDIGHGYGTAGGGLAQLGAVCRTGGKARGVTGLPSPVGDNFDVSYVGHEMGHQFNANHTFNSSSSSCLPNRRSTTAYEPGSGSTIMSYAGLCAGQNVQGGSDPYFHNVSLGEMINYVTTGFGSTCGETVETELEIPTVEAEPTATIPANTPFVLRGSSVFENGMQENVTYTWEGYDLGAASSPPPTAAWNGQAPYFRSYEPAPAAVEGEDIAFPSSGPVRFFTNLSRYTNGQNTLGEGYPSSTALLRFRLTVRNAGAGVGSVADTQVTVPVNGSAGPFVVTAPSESGTVWEGGEEVEVAWDVAGTDNASFGAENVAIYLSENRHVEFARGDAILLATVPNTGSAMVTVPAGLESTQARVYVMAAEGIFYAVNAVDLTLTPGVSAEEGTTVREARLGAVYPNPLGIQHRGTVNLTLPAPQAVRVSIIDALGREVAVLHDGLLAADGNHQFVLGGRSLAAGTYFVRAVGEQFVETRPFTVVR